MFEQAGFSKVLSIKVVSLLMKETGTYNTQQNRPYQTDMPQNLINELTNRVMQSTDKRVNGTMLAGLTSSFLQPQATPESQVHIVNGWNEKRIRFILKMRCEMAGGTVRMYYIQGYTNFAGIAQNQGIAPDMVFYVNSIVQTRLTTVSTPMGNQVYENVFQNSHVLMDDKYNNVRSPNNIKLMRPEDVFNSLQVNHLIDSDSSGFNLDSRSILHREAVLSKRSNGLGANYAASILDGYSRATTNLELGSNQSELYSQARKNTIETPACLDPFLNALSQITSNAVNNRFSYKDLLTIDPNVVNVTNYEVTGPTQLASMHQAGMTMNWTGTDRITQVATIISQSVPSLMIELLMTKVYLKSTNEGIGCVPDTRLITAKSLSDGDQTNNYNIFKNRLEQNIIADLSYNGASSYAMTLSVDLMGDTMLSISIDGSAFYDFVTPSFCDSLLVPVVTTNPETVSNLVSDFEQLTNDIYSTIGEMNHVKTSLDSNLLKLNSNF